MTVATYRPLTESNEQLSCLHNFELNGFRFSGHQSQTSALTQHPRATKTQKFLENGDPIGGGMVSGGSGDVNVIAGLPDLNQYKPTSTTKDPKKGFGSGMPQTAPTGVKPIPAGDTGPNVIGGIPTTAPGPDFSPTGDLDGDGIANSKDSFWGPGATAPKPAASASPTPPKPPKPVAAAPAPSKTEQEAAFYAAATKALDAAKAGNPQPLKDFDNFFGITRPAEEYTAEFYAPKPAAPEPVVTPEAPVAVVAPVVVEPTSSSTDSSSQDSVSDTTPDDSSSNSTSSTSDDSSDSTDDSSSSSSESEQEIENEHADEAAHSEDEKEKEAALATATATKKSSREDRMKKLNEMRKPWSFGASSSSGSDSMVVPPITPASQVPPAPL